MTLTRAQVSEVMDRTARLLADEIMAEVGDLKRYIVFDLATARNLVGLSTKQIPVYLPIVETSASKHGVTLAAIIDHIESRTVPAKRKRKEGE